MPTKNRIDQIGMAVLRFIGRGNVDPPEPRREHAKSGSLDSL